MLVITKDGPDTVLAGNYLTYIVTIRNNKRPSDAQDVHMLDVIPVLTGVTWILDGFPMGSWSNSYNLGVMISGSVAYDCVDWFGPS